MKKGLLAVAISAGLALTGCNEYWPTEEWKTGNPEDFGLNKEKMQEAQDLAKASNAWSMVVVKDGYIVSEGYYNESSVDYVTNVNSVTKSIVSLGIGIAQDQGYIDTEQALAEYFPEYINSESDEWEHDITIDNILTMSSGYEWNNWSLYAAGGEYWTWYGSDDQMQYAVDRPQAAEPGEVWNYDCPSTQFLTGIINRATGQSSLDFIQENLLNKLGINDAEDEVTEWSMSPLGFYNGAYGMKMTSRQMAKIGYLMLNNGYWDGEQVISEEYIEEARSPRIDNQFGTSYGNLWWVNQYTGAYWASGVGGQYIIIVPKYNMLVVLTSQATVPDSLDPEQTLSSENMVAITAVIGEAIEEKIEEKIEE